MQDSWLDVQVCEQHWKVVTESLTLLDEGSACIPTRGKCAKEGAHGWLCTYL